MSVLINLLPDLRQAKLREHRRRQMVSGISVLIWIICGAVVALLFIVKEGQSVAISGRTSSIASDENNLRGISGLTDALTANQHLTSLSTLYSQRAYLTHFLAAYQSADPTVITLASLNMDAQNNLTVSGNGPTYASVAKLARALADYNVSIGPNASTSNTPYFTNVNIQSISQDQNAVSFSITAVVGQGATSNGN